MTTQAGTGAARPVRVGRVKRPDLFDVLEVVREWPGCQSYVYRNKLADKGHRDFTTALVLARLRKLEALGRVNRVGPSAPPFYWMAAERLSVTPAPDAPTADRPRGGGLSSNTEIAR